MGKDNECDHLKKWPKNYNNELAVSNDLRGGCGQSYKKLHTKTKFPANT